MTIWARLAHLILGPYEPERPECHQGHIPKRPMPPPTIAIINTTPATGEQMRADTPTRIAYGDPLKAMLYEEARTCKGCAHEASGKIFGATVMICTLIRPDGARRDHGRHCKQYKEQSA